MKRFHVSRPSPAMVVALLALIVALGGSAYAAKKIGSKQLKKNAVTTKKIKNGAVTGSKIANNAVTTGKIANNAVTTGKIADNAVTAGKIAGATLDSLTIGRSTSTSCDPATSGFVDCGTVSLNLPRAGRVLVVADLAYDGSNSNGYRGACRLAVDGTAVGTTIDYGQAAYVASGGVTVVGGPGFNANGQEGGGLNVVTDALPTGTHSFALQCNQAGGSIEFSETSVSAAMLGAG
jgi:hypothetical protein